MTEDVQTSAPAEVEPEETPVEQPGEAQEAQPEKEGEAEPQADTEDQEPKASKGKGIQKRIGELTRARKEAEAEAARLKARLAEIEGKAGDKSEVEAPPKLADFETYDDYVAALAEFKAGQAFRKQQATASSKAQEVAEQRRQAAIAQEWQAKVAEAREQLPDFDAVAFREDVVISDAVRDALLDSDMGARLAYHLGKNPDLAYRLSTLPPVSVAREIGRLEVQIASQPAVSPTKAPEPPKPVKGAAKAEKDPDKMSEAEWFAWREKQLRSRQGR